MVTSLTSGWSGRSDATSELLATALDDLARSLSATLACFVPIGRGPTICSTRGAELGDLAVVESVARQWLTMTAPSATDTPVRVRTADGREVVAAAVRHGPGSPLGVLVAVDAAAPWHLDPGQAALRAAAAMLPALLERAGQPQASSMLADWAAAQVGPRSAFAVSVDDIDAVHDAFGPAIAGQLTHDYADRLERWAGTQARIARTDTSADHGTALLAIRTDLDDPASVRDCAEQLRLLMAVPIEIAIPGGPRIVSRSVSVGVAVDGPLPLGPAELLRAACNARAAAASAGGDRVTVFDPQIAERRRDRIRIGLGLDDAVREGQLRVHYQPEYDLVTGRMVAVEALLRWQHPRFGLLAAEQFVPGTEHTYPFTAVQRWVIDEACRQLRVWTDTGAADELAVRVNAAAAQVLSGEVTRTLLQVGKRHGLNLQRICVELTERTLPSDAATISDLAAALSAWHEHSIRVAIDDFGTGQGTLTHLLDLPIDVLKLDQTYVTRMTSSPRAHAIVSGMLTLAKDLGIDTVVAEGVDGPDTRDALVALGCRHAQGNWLTPAAPPEQITQLLREQASSHR